MRQDETRSATQGPFTKQLMSMGVWVGGRQLMSMQGGSWDAVDTGARHGLATCGPQHQFLKGPLRL